jgi:DeoR/GlpR family transcriptional regulator of sugar metabolism
MGIGKNKTEARREKIIMLLQEKGKASVLEFSEYFSTSEVTIRKDLDYLDKSGKLTRVVGGAVLPVSSAPSDSDPIKNLNEKVAIATELAKIIENGSTIFINSGTTCEEIAKALKSKEALSIVTNSFDVAKAVNDNPGFRVILLGGELNSVFNFTYGSDAQEQLSNYRADYSIISVDGISSDGSITTGHAEEAIIDRMMISHSKRTVIAADHSKIGNEGFLKVCDINYEKFSLITDELSDKRIVDDFISGGMDVKVANKAVFLPPPRKK